MNIFNDLNEKLEVILTALTAEKVLPEGLSFKGVSIEPPRDKSHGDVAINAALVLAKPAGKNPREIAEKIAEKLRADETVRAVDVVGPGFINVTFMDSFWQVQVPEILKANKKYAASKMGQGSKVNVEYVSANPTGPLHVGHVRGAVFGDALANLLEKVGYTVTREYYINDAGAQIDTLARSAHLRYREALGEDIGEIPEGLYPGEYLIPLGQALAAEFGEKYKNLAEEDWLSVFRYKAVHAMMDLIRDDLKALGIEHEMFFSENSLLTTGRVKEALDFLRGKGVIYEGVLEPPKGKKPEGWEAREQTLFKTTAFGDDVDRPVMKSDGSYTYFASDIAYHYDKFKRGFLDQILVVGADHAGYVKRLKAALAAMSDSKGDLDVRLCQMVKLYKGGAPYKMSKRAGTFVTLRDLVDEVGPGVVRFIMLTRKNDAQLDFDFDKVLEQSRDNPVFYVQYAHARSHSAFRKAAEIMPGLDISENTLKKADPALLETEAEIGLIKSLSQWPRMVESAAEAHEPHRIAFYLYDLASDFHGLWNKGNDDPAMRFVLEDNEALTLARLALVKSLTLVIAEGLELLGVTPLEELH